MAWPVIQAVLSMAQQQQNKNNEAVSGIKPASLGEGMDTKGLSIGGGSGGAGGFLGALLDATKKKPGAGTTAGTVDAGTSSNMSNMG